VEVAKAASEAARTFRAFESYAEQPCCRYDDRLGSVLVGNVPARDRDFLGAVLPPLDLENDRGHCHHATADQMVVGVHGAAHFAKPAPPGFHPGGLVFSCRRMQCTCCSSLCCYGCFCDHEDRRTGADA